MSLNRRQLLQRAGALGLIVAAPTVLQRFWALDQTMLAPQNVWGNWVEAKEPISQSWMLWLKGPERQAGPFMEVIAARDWPSLIDGGHWKMVFDAGISQTYGPTGLINYVERELTDLTGVPARVASVNGTPVYER